MLTGTPKSKKSVVRIDAGCRVGDVRAAKDSNKLGHHLLRRDVLVGKDLPQAGAGACHGEAGVTEDAISIGGVDLTDPNSYLAGPPLDAFRKLRERAPVHCSRLPHGGIDEIVFALPADGAAIARRGFPQPVCIDQHRDRRIKRLTFTQAGQVRFVRRTAQLALVELA